MNNKEKIIKVKILKEQFKKEKFIFYWSYNLVDPKDLPDYCLVCTGDKGYVISTKAFPYSLIEYGEFVKILIFEKKEDSFNLTYPNTYELDIIKSCMRKKEEPWKIL